MFYWRDQGLKVVKKQSKNGPVAKMYPILKFYRSKITRVEFF